MVVNKFIVANCLQRNRVQTIRQHRAPQTALYVCAYVDVCMVLSDLSVSELHRMRNTRDMIGSDLLLVSVSCGH